MATKKQKRLAGEAKQAINRAETIRLGLVAQQKERELIERKKQQAAINRKKKENAELLKSVAQTTNVDYTMDMFVDEAEAADADRMEEDRVLWMAGGMD